jgi:hypothetical protein
MDAAGRHPREEFKSMADDESLLTNPPTQEVAVHVRDYSRFTKLFKYGAIVCFIIAMLVVFIIS